MGVYTFFPPHMPILLHFLNSQIGGETMNNSTNLKNGPNLNWNLLFHCSQRKKKCFPSLSYSCFSSLHEKIKIKAYFHNNKKITIKRTRFFFKSWILFIILLLSHFFPSKFPRNKRNKNKKLHILSIVLLFLLLSITILRRK